MLKRTKSEKKNEEDDFLSFHSPMPYLDPMQPEAKKTVEIDVQEPSPRPMSSMHPLPMPLPQTSSAHPLQPSIQPSLQHSPQHSLKPSNHPESDQNARTTKEAKGTQANSTETIFLAIAAVVLTIGLTVASVINYQLMTDDTLQKTTDKSNAPKKTKILTDTTGLCMTPECIMTASDISSNLDLRIKPCDDFYNFACGKWIEKTTLGDSDRKKSRMKKLMRARDHKIERLFTEPLLPNQPFVGRKAEMLFTSCKNDAQNGANHFKSLNKRLKLEFGGWPMTNPTWMENEFELLVMIRRLKTYNFEPLFKLGVGTSLMNSSLNVIMLNQPSLALSDPQVYIRDKDSNKLQYLQDLIVDVASYMDMENTVTLKEDAQEIIEFESMLASIVKTYDTDDFKSDMKMTTLKEVQKILGGILDWTSFIPDLFGAPEIGITDITDGEVIVIFAWSYFQKLPNVLQTAKKRIMANYLIWSFIYHLMEDHCLGNIADNLIEIFKTEVTGETNIFSREHHCSTYVYSKMPLAADSMFADKYSDKGSRETVKEMVKNLQLAFNEIFDHTDILDAATRKIFKEKNSLMKIHVAFLDVMENKTSVDNYYTHLRFNQTGFLANAMHVDQILNEINLRTLRKLNNVSSWLEGPQDEFVFFNPLFNALTISNAALQPNLYFQNAPMSLSFGALGAMVAKEMTHSFDFVGKDFDKLGNMNSTWTQSTTANFKKKLDCLAQQYNKFRVYDSKLHCDGRITVNDNFAVNSGLLMAYKVYKSWLKKQTAPELKLINLNFTHNQLFFITFAQMHCAKMIKEETFFEVFNKATTIEPYRVLGALINLNDFAEAFQCPEESPMNPTKKCFTW